MCGGSCSCQLLRLVRVIVVDIVFRVAVVIIAVVVTRHSNHGHSLWPEKHAVAHSTHKVPLALHTAVILASGRLELDTDPFARGKMRLAGKTDDAARAILQLDNMADGRLHGTGLQEKEKKKRGEREEGIRNGPGEMVKIANASEGRDQAWQDAICCRGKVDCEQKRDCHRLVI